MFLHVETKWRLTQNLQLLSAGILSDAYFSNSIFRFSAGIQLSRPIDGGKRAGFIFHFWKKGRVHFWLFKKGREQFWLLKEGRAHFWLLKKGQGAAPSEIRKTWTLAILHRLWVHSCLWYIFKLKGLSLNEACKEKEYLLLNCGHVIEVTTSLLVPVTLPISYR